MRSRRLWAAAFAVFALVIGGGNASACGLLELCPDGADGPERTGSAPRTERWLLDAINGEREQRGLSPVAWDASLDDMATQHARRMARAARVFHNEEGLRARRARTGETLGENVGVGVDLDDVHAAFVASAPHRHTLLGPYARVGLGIVRRGPEAYVVEVFATRGGHRVAPADASALSSGQEPPRRSLAARGEPVLVRVARAPRPTPPALATRPSGASTQPVIPILVIGGLIAGLRVLRRVRIWTGSANG